MFVYLWLYWVLAAAGTHSSCGEMGLLSSFGAWPSHRFSARGAWVQVLAPRCQSKGSTAVAPGHGCSLAYGIVPDQGSNPSPELAGGLFITEPSGKPSLFIF